MIFKFIILFSLLQFCVNEGEWIQSHLQSDNFKEEFAGIDFDSEVTIYLESKFQIEIESFEARIISYEKDEYNFFSRSFRNKNKNTTVVQQIDKNNSFLFFRPYSGSAVTYKLIKEFKIIDIERGTF